MATQPVMPPMAEVGSRSELAGQFTAYHNSDLLVPTHLSGHVAIVAFAPIGVELQNADEVVDALEQEDFFTDGDRVLIATTDTSSSQSADVLRSSATTQALAETVLVRGLGVEVIPIYREGFITVDSHLPFGSSGRESFKPLNGKIPERDMQRSKEARATYASILDAILSDPYGLVRNNADPFQEEINLDIKLILLATEPRVEPIRNSLSKIRTSLRAV